jgi:HK97 family phage prohead protease
MKTYAIEERDADGVLSDRMMIEGYAVLFDEPQTYQFGDTTYTEIIRKGALDNADMKRVVLRYNHNDTVMALARVKNGSLQLTIDDKGLLVRAELLDTQSNRDLYKSIRNGLIDEMSFAFTVAPDGDVWTYENDYSVVTREINAIETLYDVSVVDTGFYEKTSVYARTIDKVDTLKKESELRKLDLIKAKAIAIANL